MPCYLTESTHIMSKYQIRGFPGGSVVKNPPAKAVDVRSIPGPEDPVCLREAGTVCQSY